MSQLRVAAYCRVSSLDQVQGVLTVRGSLAEQEDKARAYAEQQGWEMVQVYVEAGISGEKFDERKALQTMLEDAKRGLFQILIVKAGDRLARDQEVFFRITKILNQYYNVQILNLANPSQIVEPSTFTGRRNPMLIVQQGFDAMMGAFDQARRFDMLMEGKRRQARAGRFTATYILYGYQLEYNIVGGRKVDRVPVPDPKEYWVLELLPKLVLEENLSDREIAKRLTELGARSREGGAWRKNSVSRMITHPFNGGKITFGRQVSKTNHESGKVRPVKNPNPETIIYADHNYQHPWSWETFQAMQERRQARRQSPPRQTTSRSPLAGLLVCAYCGHSMVLRIGNGEPGRVVNRWVTWKDGSRHFRPHKANTRRSDSFVCGYHNSSPSACQVNRVPVKLVMDRLIILFKDLAAQKEADPASFYASIQETDQSARRTTVETRLKAAKAELLETIPAKIDRLNRGYLNGMVSEEQYPALTKIIDEDKDRLQHAIMDLEGELRKIEAASQRIEKLRRFTDELEVMIERFKQPVSEWEEIETRKAQLWLKSRYKKIAVSLEKPGEGEGEEGSGGRVLNLSYELIPL